MLSKWPIRNKLLVGLALLMIIIGMLAGSGFVGLYAYRALVKSLSDRAAELPLATKLGRLAGDLRVTLSKCRAAAEERDESTEDPEPRQRLRAQFAAQLQEYRETLEAYRALLGPEVRGNEQIGDRHREQETVAEIDQVLLPIDRDVPRLFDARGVDRLASALAELQDLTAELPSHLHRLIHHLADQVRLEYRTLIVLAWVSSFATGLLIALFIRLAYVWVFRPLRLLVKGSRRVAAGDFDYRVHLDSRDEMAELAEALNDMTARFQEIRDDLDRQVQERTRQVVRSEQLASVGFLAAGVAHEINNPLASIAMCAESLEGRLEDLLPAENPEHQLACRYLRMIQTEAFRCKEITGKLLDFSRLGNSRREPTELRELVEGVIDMVSHLGKYQDRQIELLPGPAVTVPVNAQEIKQVVLNLITNGLDSMEPGGRLAIEVHPKRELAELVFTDDGCGMTPEVREHLFEPFFTRRRSGQGTGLGLSISYRIVADHGGYIEAASEGPGRGSQFRVGLPLIESHKEVDHRYQAA